MPWSLSPSHHGIELILDEAGQTVGQVERDPRGFAWHVSACPERFPERTGLPRQFCGCTEFWFPKRGEMLRFFGIPLPGAAEPNRATRGGAETVEAA